MSVNFECGDKLPTRFCEPRRERGELAAMRRARCGRTSYADTDNL